MGKKRQYTDNDKAAALAALDANKGNLSKTAKQLGIPRQTIQEWAAGRNHNRSVPDLRQVKKRDLAEKLEEAADALLDNILARARSETSVAVPLKDFATAMGIAIDKMQLLKGEPTSINKTLTDEERATKAAEILERGKLRLVKP